MSSPRIPKRPTVTAVYDCLHQFDTSEKYALQETALALLFQQYCPSNTDIAQVLLKVSTLNDFYSTNIFDTHAVAKHITQIEIAQRLADGDPLLVNEIATVLIGGKVRNFYSFATKYCNHHNPESFPIYDSYVEKMLVYFQKVDRFTQFSRLELKQYDKFVCIIREFRQYYALTQFTLREIDVYLWLAGRDAFSSYTQGSPTD